MKICDLQFRFVEKIEPGRDENGCMKLFMPQQRYERANEEYVHRHGWGPFCDFKISKIWKGKSGVYVFFADGEPKYVGECEDLLKRVNNGYGHISPRNCFKGGRETNCRINHTILESVRRGKEIKLFFFETKERKALEDKLKGELKPEWNMEIGTETDTATFPKSKIRTQGTSYMGKYKLLYEYLQKCTRSKVEMSFSEIEEILGFKLPRSAHEYRAWWSNGGHSHSHAWIMTGCYVKQVNLSQGYVVFQKSRS